MIFHEERSTISYSIVSSKNIKNMFIYPREIVNDQLSRSIFLIFQKEKSILSYYSTNHNTRILVVKLGT